MRKRSTGQHIRNLRRCLAEVNRTLTSDPVFASMMGILAVHARYDGLPRPLICTVRRIVRAGIEQRSRVREHVDCLGKFKGGRGSCRAEIVFIGSAGASPSRANVGIDQHMPSAYSISTSGQTLYRSLALRVFLTSSTCSRTRLRSTALDGHRTGGGKMRRLFRLG